MATVVLFPVEVETVKVNVDLFSLELLNRFAALQAMFHVRLNFRYRPRINIVGDQHLDL